MVFEIVAQRLADIGFYNFFLPFVLTAAIIYGLLTKTKVLGENPVVIGVISLSAGLIIFGLPVLLGISITKPFTTFFLSAISFIILGVVGLLIAGTFFPGAEKLFETFKGWGPWLLIVALIIGIISGFFNVIVNPITKLSSPGFDIVIVFGILILALIIIIIVTASRGG